MKNDTSINTEQLFRKLILQKSNEDRLIMGCSMYNTAKELVKSSILNENPNISTNNLKIEILKRFYGNEIKLDLIIWKINEFKQ